jgi:adenylate cyclase
MTEERLQRRLAAILAADVVGYSRMMAADEGGTLAKLKALRAEIFDPITAKLGGRIFKNTGDGALAEFSSAVDAVQSAMEVQQALGALAKDDGIVLRIGISLGDVIVDGDDLFGNAVNVAARMEALAEPGSICVSGNVHEHIGTALDVDFQDIGAQLVKNIDQPIHSYRVLMDGISPSTPSERQRSVTDKPSIAVLPFENMSGDPEQEYFADGMTEEIITALSRIDSIFVIARNSSFTFKGRSVDVRDVARELGVLYVLEGSVRRGGSKVRITGQLIDAESGAHLWADRFDGDLENIFDLQDSIAESVVGVVEPTLREAEIARSQRKGPKISMPMIFCCVRCQTFLPSRRTKMPSRFRCLKKPSTLILNWRRPWRFRHGACSKGRPSIGKTNPMKAGRWPPV